MGALRIDDRLQPEDCALLARVGEVAAATGVAAYLVGGPVRDMLLDRPAPDLDVAIEGSIREITEALGRRIGARVRKTTEFMTSTLLLENGRELDLARTRTEVYPEPGALPVVTPAKLAGDLGRRDFSVNAMAMSLEPRHFGELIDPHGGREDIEHRHLRVLHDRSFEDDPTRMLRAARFVVRLDFALETRTAALLERAAAERRPGAVSGARLRNELECLFREAPARGLATLQALRLLEGMGLMAASSRACDAAQVIPLAACKLRLDLSKIGPLTSSLGVYAGLSAQDAADLGRRLMLGACTRDAMLQSAALIEHPPGVLMRHASDGELFFALRGLHPASVIALWTVLDAHARARLERYWLELRGTCADIDGADLIASGYEPGPSFTAALDGALRAKLNDDAEREEQLVVALHVLENTLE